MKVLTSEWRNFLIKTLRNFNSLTNNIMDTSLKRDGTCGTKLTKHSCETLSEKLEVRD